MIEDTITLDALKSIGLNLYERKIFVSLLTKGIATAAEVSEMANVPRSRSYDVLESLAEKGFVLVQPSKPIKYVALKPKEAIERVKENLSRKHNTMLERIERVKSSEILDKLEQIYEEGFNHVSPSEITGILKGTMVIDRQLRSVIKDSQESIKISTTEKGLTNLFTKHYRYLKKASKRGVKLQILAPLRDEEVVRMFAGFTELRDTEKNMGRFCLVDDRHLLMTLTDEETHETQDVMLWADSPYVVKFVVGALFHNEWESSQVSSQ